MRWGSGAVAVLVGTLLCACQETVPRVTPGDGGGEDPPPAQPPPDPPLPPPPPPGVIAQENARPGTQAWQLTRTSSRQQISGYALAQSATPGTDVPVAVSVTGARTTFTWTAYRMGFYAGAGGRQIAAGGPVDVAPQAGCTPQAGTGMVACGWAPSFTLHVGEDWVGGVYLLKLKRADGYEAYVPLVVRSPARADVLVVIPTATWQAYNEYGGTSLYDDDDGVSGFGHAVKVSYDRPYLRGAGTGDFLAHDQHAVTFLEAQGLEVRYATDEDLDGAAAAALDGVKAVVLSAHDEYWSRGIRDAVEGAVKRGTSLLLLGANAAYWQTRYGPASDGRPRRTIACYKEAARRADPVGPQSPELTTRFRDAPVNRPEAALFGVMFDHSWNQFGFPAVVTNPSHWAFGGTGLAAGDLLPSSAGYEADSTSASSPAGVEILADSPLMSLVGGPARAQMVVRGQGPGLVFASGGIDFVRTLGDPELADPRAQRLLANVLYRAIGAAVPAALVLRPPESGLISGPATTAGEPLGAGALSMPAGVALLPGGAFAVADAQKHQVMAIEATGAVRVLAGGGALGPVIGIAADPAGAVYFADYDGSCIHRVDPQGRDEVIAGLCGSPGEVNGVGTAARFSSPVALALGPDGLYVADVVGGTVRRISLGGAHAVSTVLSGLSRPSALAFGPDGSLYVAETGMLQIARYQGGRREVVAGSGSIGVRDGAADQARVLPYGGLAVLRDGSVVFSDQGSARVRRISGGQVTTLAQVSLPGGLAVAPDGSLLVAAAGSGAVLRIRP